MHYDVHLYFLYKRLQYFIYVTRTVITVCIYPRACSRRRCRVMICIFRWSQQTLVCDDIQCRLQ